AEILPHVVRSTGRPFGSQITHETTGADCPAETATARFRSGIGKPSIVWLIVGAETLWLLHGAFTPGGTAGFGSSTIGGDGGVGSGGGFTTGGACMGWRTIG